MEKTNKYSLADMTSSVVQETVYLTSVDVREHSNRSVLARPQDARPALRLAQATDTGFSCDRQKDNTQIKSR